MTSVNYLVTNIEKILKYKNKETYYINSVYLKEELCWAKTEKYPKSRW
jgi:hypothetical protein